MQVRTGSEKGAGTDAAVEVRLHGDGGKASEWTRLERSLTNSNPFERAQTDEFKLLLQPVQVLSALEIKSDASGLGGDWLLDDITVSSGSVEVYFPCFQWLQRTVCACR